jgi:hypothetical protein
VCLIASEFSSAPTCRGAAEDGKRQPNKRLQPTIASVTTLADARLAPATLAAEANVMCIPKIFKIYVESFSAFHSIVF